MTDILTIDWDDDAPVISKPKIQLRGPQPGWVDAIEADLKTHTRLLAVAPGGIGKSTVFAFLAARMWARGIRTLVLENRDRLTRQTAKRLADETGLQVEIEMGDEHASPFAPIVVACVQSLGRTNRLTGFADDHFGMVVADECVPGSTTVGDKTISTIIPGDLVPSMNHSTGLIERRKVIATSVRSTNRLIKITSHGRRLYCTPNHPVYTERGYIEAKDVQVFDKISIRRTGMRNVRNASFEERAFSRDKKAEVLAVLHKVKRIEGDGFDSCVQALRKTSAVQGEEGVVHELGCGEVQSRLLFKRVREEMEGRECACVSRRKDEGAWAYGRRIGAYEESESDEISGRSPAGGCEAQRQDIHREGRKWEDDETARGTGVGLGWGSNGARDTDRHGEWPISVVAPVLQGGRCNTRGEAGNRGGWEQPPIKEMEVPGSQENGDTEFFGVDCVEVLERGGGVEFGEVCPDGLVYNLEVEGNSNYFANGILVHNCHLSLANQWQRILNYFHYGADSLAEDWCAPPDGTYQPKASVVGFTASPDIGDRKNLGQFYQKRSVDYTYLEAVEDGWLVGIRQTSIPVKIDLKKYKARSTPTGMDFSTNDLSAAMVPIIEELAEQHAKHARDKKSIAFLPSVECARMMTDALIRRGIKSMFVSGECFDGDEKTEDFVRSGPGTTLCNAMIYTYGVDFPDVNCIGWYRATVSKAFYIQGIYRGTRVLPGTIDGLSTAQARREAIARSPKDILTILDPLFVSDRIDLMEPYDLFTDKPEVKKQMKEKGELNPESAREGERDFIKALEKAAKKNAHKAARTIDPVAFALNIGDSALAHYEPQTDREAAPMTVGQREYLQRNRIDISKVTCLGYAQRLIGRHVQRFKLGLATAEQLAFLKQLGFNDADTVKMSEREAKEAIGARLKRK